MDVLSETLSNVIYDASDASIPRITVSIKSKPWWSDNIRDLRKQIAAISRKSVKNPYYMQEYRNAKNRYFNAIKRAKIEH